MFTDDKHIALPNEKGELEIGEYKPQAGDLMRKPKTNQERIDALKAIGVKFNEDFKTSQGTFTK